MTDPEFLGDVYSSEQPFGRPVPGPGDDHTRPAADGASELETEPATEAEVSADVNPGLLMSFLTDFRSAEYELIRMKRAAELEQSRRKTRPQHAAPAAEEPVVEEPVAQLEDYAPPATGDYQVSGDYPVSDSDFLVAASEAEESGRNRLRLGLPSFRNLGQSPATA